MASPTTTNRHFFARPLRHYLLLGILVAAFVIRAGFSLYKPPVIMDVLVAQQTELVNRTGISAKTIEMLKENDLLQSDAYIYHLLGKNLAASHGYSESRNAPYEPTRVRTPGYPAFIALVYLIFGPDHRILLIAQALLGTLTTLLAYLLARRVFDFRASLLAALAVAFYPALIYYDSLVLREGFIGTLLILTVFLSTCRFDKKITPLHLLAIGVLLSWLSMAKPELILLFAPVVFVIIYPRRNLQTVCKTACLVALPLIIVWGSWTARNYITFGSLSPVTVGLGSTIWFGNRWADIGGEDRTQKDHLKLNVHARDTVREIAKTGGESAIERTFTQMLLKDITQKPGWFIGMTLKKAYLFWKDANGTKKTLPAIHPRLPDAVNACYYLLLAFAVAAIVLTRRSREWVMPLALVVFTFMAAYALLHVRNRYRVPVMPLVLVLSAGGFWAVYDLFKASLPEKVKHRMAAWTLRKSAPKNFSFPRIGERSGENP